MPSTIIGVDFSGARSDHNTWLTRGKLTDHGKLLLDGAQPIRRADLHDLLPAVPTPAVAALDFPFGVPSQFANSLSPQRPPSDLPVLWRVVAGMTQAEFIAARNAFVASHGEPKRAGDRKYHPESYSPLHNVNPNMLPMTHAGIQLLHQWHQDHPLRWRIPPLPPACPPLAGHSGFRRNPRVTLLELMPGALLKSLSLPYKGYKRGRESTQRRTAILNGLAPKSGISLPNLDTVYADCLANDDCLDSLVAAVGAAMWAQDNTRFRHPDDDELPDAQLEGWIYVPKPK